MDVEPRDVKMAVLESIEDERMLWHLTWTAH